MIQQLRSYSESIFFKALLGFIAITFVISFGIGAISGDKKEVIATVNHTEILMKDYQRAYQNQLQSLQANLGEQAEQFAQQFNLKQRVLEQLINQQLLIDEAKNLGIFTTDKELKEYITEQPYFQKNGHFDFETYQTILKQNRLTIDDYEKLQRKDLLLQKIRNILGEGIVASAAEVDLEYRMDQEKMAVDFIAFTTDPFLSQVQWTEEELNKTYEDSKLEYKTPRQFKIAYIPLKLDAFIPEAVKDREIERYYEKNKTDYTQQAEVKARHILLKVEADATDAQKTEKKQFLESLRARILKGESFEGLARIYSEDGTKDKGGDLGWFKVGEMVPEFEKAAFALNPGEVSPLVESPFGYHLIQVDEKRPEIIASLDDVKDEIADLLKSKRAEKLLDRALENLETRMTTLKELDEIAKEFQQTIVTTEWFSEDTVIPGLGSAKPLVSTLRHKSADDLGTWKRNPVVGHVVYKLVELKEPEIRPLAEVKVAVEEKIRNAKAEQQAWDKAQESLTQLREGTSLEDIAQRYSFKIESVSLNIKSNNLPGVGSNTEFKKTAFDLSQASPYGLSRNTQKQMHLLRFKQRQLEAGDATAKKLELRQRLFESSQNSIVEKRIQQLRESATIKILNPLFNQAAQG
ncbi:MAG: SurA N-terminal domain-containing protein [SAR324 cluster bacterium]|nr:SurA N-terminal domain-containing protein [SAR324 cluster bacterium]